MATAIPPTSAINAMFKAKNFTRLAQLEADSQRHDREDFRTVNTDRGPVRGLR
jgi:hypothetical protein